MKFKISQQLSFFKIACFLFFFIFSNINHAKELPMVVLICSYNNASWVEQNLKSVFEQNYNNYSVFYVDDASQDGTADLVSQYVHKNGFSNRFVLMKNKERCRKLKNLYNAGHLIADEKIVVLLDGDDWFSHKNVLSDINNAYLDDDIWMTYGTHENCPKSFAAVDKVKYQRKQFSKDILEKRLYRTIWHCPTRSWYSWLFKLIKLENLISTEVPNFEGKFFPALVDCAIMWPMAEMAHLHQKYMKKTSYIANRYNPINSHKVDKILQRKGSAELKQNMPVYSPINFPIFDRMKKLKDARADIIILGGTIQSLNNLINSIKTNVMNFSAIHVLCTNYRSKNILNSAFPEVNFEKNRKLTVNKLIGYIQKLKSSHIILCESNYKIKKTINCNDVIKQLEKTFAFAFYFDLNSSFFKRNKIPYEHITEKNYAWKFKCDKNRKIDILGVNFVLYRKNDLLKILHQMKFKKSIFSLEDLKDISYDASAIGLFNDNKDINNITDPREKKILNYLIKDKNNLFRLQSVYDREKNKASQGFLNIIKNLILSAAKRQIKRF